MGLRSQIWIPDQFSIYLTIENRGFYTIYQHFSYSQQPSIMFCLILFLNVVLRDILDTVTHYVTG